MIDAEERQLVSLQVNGVEYRGYVEPRKLLADFLREDIGLTGTHVGCEQGVCGACTILVDGQTIRSCLMFAVQASGSEIVTVEGIARDGRLHTLQEAFHTHHALQCGFCTPGFLIAGLELLRENPRRTAAEIREAIAGNLCRCTGYQNIVRAILAASRAMAEKGSET